MSDAVTRWNVGEDGSAYPDTEGPFVMYETIEQLESENAKLRAGLKTIAAYFEGRCDVDIRKVANDALKGGSDE